MIYTRYRLVHGGDCELSDFRGGAIDWTDSEVWKHMRKQVYYLYVNVHEYLF